MNIVVTIYTAILFFLLSPGVLVRLPPKGSKMMVVAVHALIFALILGFTGKMVWKLSMRLEGMEGIGPNVPTAAMGPQMPSIDPKKKADTAIPSAR
jgi:hypothetical protein